MKHISQGKASRWATLLSWITTAPVQTSSQQLITLQLILAWSIIIAIGYALAYQLLLQEAPIAPLWRLVIFIIFYAVSRTRYYLIAILGVVIWMIIQPYTMFIIPEVQRELTMMIILSVIAIPLAGLLLPKRVLYFVSLLVVTNLLFLRFVLPSVDPLLVLILIVISASIMIWFLIWNEVLQSKKHSNYPHEQLVQVSPDIMAIIVKNQFTYINPAGVQLLGANNHNEIIGKPLSTVIPSSNNNTSNSNKYTINTSHLGEMIIQSVETIQRLDGNSYRALVTLTPFEQEGGMATLLTAKSLPSSLSQPEQILESTVAILVVRQNNKIVYVSSQFERLTGYSREEIHWIDDTPLRHTYIDDRERFSKWLEEVQAGTNESKSIEYRMYREDKSVIWVSTICSTIHYNGKPAILTTTIDITPYRSASPSASVKDVMPYPWLRVKNQEDATTIVDYHSGKFEWFQDNTPLIGQQVSHLISGLPPSLFPILNMATQYNDVYVQRSMFKNANVDELPIEWTATPLEDDDSADYLITLRATDYETLLENDLHRYRTLFDMMNDYAFLIKVLPDNRFKYIWVGDAFEKITGFNPLVYSVEEITAQTTYPADEAIMQQHLDQLMRGEMSVVEHRIVTKTGQIRWIRQYVYPEVEDEHTTLIYGSVSDITDLVQAEEAVRNSALQQSVIAEIGLVAVRGNLDIEDFAQQALSLVTQLMMVPWCVLIEYHQDQQKFTGHTMIGKPVLGEIESKPDDKNSYLGYVLHQNAPIIVQDWSKETRFKLPQAFVDLGIQTSLGVVIPMQDEPFGILNVHDSTPRQFSGANINLLQTIANIIGAYIQQRQTQIAERENRIMAEALIDITAVLSSRTELNDILRLILDFVSQIVPVVDSSNIMLVDREKETVNITIRHTINSDIRHTPAGVEIALSDVPFFVKMIETGEPIVLNNVNEVDGWYVIPETNWIQSYLGAPIFVGSECIGVVSLDSRHQDAFTSEDLKKMQAFLDQASIAIQNARHAEELAKEVEKRTQELQSERAQLQAILNSTGEGIFYTHGQSKTMLFINHALADMMGYKPQELWNKSSLIFRPDDLTEEEIKVRKDIQSAVKVAGLTRAELRFKRKDGTIIMVGVTVSQVSYEHDILESVTVVRDISKEKEIEAQKETFISNAAHELRGPITTLNTRMYVMKNKEDAPQEDIAKLDVVIQKMNALIAGLLDLSRFESGRIKLNLQSVILQTVLDDVMAYQRPEAEKKHMTLNYVAPDEPITMIADELRFNQVLTNFVSNSINYTLEGGNIDIRVHYANDSHNMVIIEVIDNGIGIDEDSLKTIFQPFSQAHNNTFNSGTGLGLSISKQIVEAHGGHIEVDSVEGEGSRFILHMPTTAVNQDEL